MTIGMSTLFRERALLYKLSLGVFVHSHHLYSGTLCHITWNCQDWNPIQISDKNHFFSCPQMFLLTFEFLLLFWCFFCILCYLPCALRLLCEALYKMCIITIVFIIIIIIISCYHSMQKKDRFVLCASNSLSRATYRSFRSQGLFQDPRCSQKHRLL